MYTTRNKAEDRFGFEAGGTFRIPYRHDRPAAAIGAIIVGTIAVLVIINLVSMFEIMIHTGRDISGYINTIIYGSLEESQNAEGGNTLFRTAAAFQGTVFGAAILSVLTVIFIIMCGKLHNGHICSFTANDEMFVITYPPKMNKVTAIFYEDIIDMKWKERKFPFTPVCYDITITSHSGDMKFSVILTPLARVNGISETPFNIIYEKININRN